MGDPLASVWLVGLSGAGKSTVGPIVAGRLGFRFVDLDRRVERLAGCSVERIFATEGEGAFRALEAAASREVMEEEGVVVATGGGWMARTDLPRTVRGCIRVWLRVRPETAIHRLADSGSEPRPLLAGSDPVADLRRLLGARERAYAEAEMSVDTDGLGPGEVADVVMERLATLAEGPVEGQETEHKP